MELLLTDVEARGRLRIDQECPMSDDEYFEFCSRNSDLRIERTAKGEIVIMPPTGFETGFRNNHVARQLGNWALEDGRGHAFDSSTEYLLPDGSALSPDASWVSDAVVRRLTKQQRRKFAPLCPEFVVELTSPSDRLGTVKVKMRAWMNNGVKLGWLIDPDRQTVYIYRGSDEPEKRTGIDSIDGEGPVAGFRLDLREIWAGL